MAGEEEEDRSWMHFLGDENVLTDNEIWQRALQSLREDGVQFAEEMLAEDSASDEEHADEGIPGSFKHLKRHWHDPVYEGADMTVAQASSSLPNALQLRCLTL
jgi:hypothetical protein